jgi:GNAT superfamily N-acetyltransferase
VADTKNIVRILERVAADPRKAHEWMKLIDGDPRPGTSLIMGRRVRTFCDLHTRQVFYEPLSGQDSIVRVLAQMWRIGEGAWVGSDKRDWVQIAFDIFESAYTAPHGRLDLPRAGEQPVGVHAVAVVGYENSGETLLFRNSWGAGWGDRGLGSVSRNYLQQHLRDAFLSRNARYAFTRFDLAAASAARTARETASVWLRENPRWTRWIMHQGRRRRLFLYETISVEDQVPVTVLELRTGEGFRLGWAMLFHERDGGSVLKELFVWPHFRRQGYGTVIEREAVAVACRWHSAKMQVYLHSADAIAGNRVAGRVFGLKAGYQWRWRRTALPNLDAIGEKTL